eukprot:200116-Pelagomonas_calceolata.AAC.1
MSTGTALRAPLCQASKKQTGSTPLKIVKLSMWNGIPNGKLLICYKCKQIYTPMSKPLRRKGWNT